jgi:hypothetical protein
MPRLSRSGAFDVVAVFCFLIAAIQFFLAGQAKPALAFTGFGLVALLVGRIWLDEEEVLSHPTPKPQTSDQAPGEEVVQVNDAYVGGAQASEDKPDADMQHPTGG